MFRSFRHRVLIWLLAALLPISIAGAMAFSFIADDLAARVETDLDNVRRLEAARIRQVLRTYVVEAQSFAAGAHVVNFTAEVVAARSGEFSVDATIGGYDGFARIDAMSDRPLQQLVGAVQEKSRATAARGVEFRITSVHGATLGETASFSWQPYDPTVVDKVLADGQPRFGNAFRQADGEEVVALVAPIVTATGQIVGALEIEMMLDPVTGFITAHEGFGDSSEAHIAQPTADGDAEFITLLRFERDAAFTKVVPQSKNLPINQSLESPGGRTVVSPDYRAVESILSIETIPETGWGLVVKIDRSEALAPLNRVRWVTGLAAAAALAAVILGWVLLMRPFGRRLRRISAAASRVAAGQAAPLNDSTNDEVGAMARAIDRLAANLAADQRVREDYERELLRHATRDDLTGLINRQHATQLVANVLQHPASSATVSESSMMFIDLDGFKSINDTYGHLVGDEVLVSVASRLREAAPANAIVSRWGGDEFVIVLPGATRRDAEEFAAVARRAFEIPFATSIGPLLVRWSSGIATSGSGQTLDQLLHEADSRMFEEKQALIGGVAVQSRVLRDVELALSEHRVEAYLQPIVSVAEDNSTVLWGAEALVRLRDPDGSVRSPGEFLAAAQNNRLGAAIDDRVAALAIGSVGAWRKQGLIRDDFRLMINVCEASSRDEGHAQRLADLLDLADLPPQCLAVEISEETRELDPASLDALRDRGIGVAIDDIGAARSGVARIFDSGADIGKVDGRWTMAKLGDEPMVARLAQLCHALDMQTIVEGVETEEHRDVLLALGLTCHQGYLYGRPVPASDFIARWGHVGVAAGRNPVQVSP